MILQYRLADKSLRDQLTSEIVRDANAKLHPLIRDELKQAQAMAELRNSPKDDLAAYADSSVTSISDAGLSNLAREVILQWARTPSHGNYTWASEQLGLLVFSHRYPTRTLDQWQQVRDLWYPLGFP